ncbi:MAG: hypothetical protein Q9220_002466 [cf. Caloplaca sp. 1 TL-2023]
MAHVASTGGIYRWILDVEPAWPCSETIRPGRNAAARWAAEHDNQQVLDLLPSEEREKVLRFYHVRDAKLSLGSQLLKHCAIVETCQIRWPESIITRDKNHKPCYVPRDAPEKQIEFNVSHHGSLVVLAGCANDNVQIGVDVVQIDLSKDIPKVRAEGWPSWVCTYEAVFSAQEVQDMVAWEPSQFLSGDALLRAKLRHFYAHWCLKEAYVKMTGEALMAPWLQDMEFRKVQVPRSADEVPNSPDDGGWGEVYSGVEIWRDGRQVTGVRIEIQAFREDYLIGIAVSDLDLPLSAYKMIDLTRDVYPLAGLR